MNVMTFAHIRRSDEHFLYTLLAIRPTRANISHRRTPTWAQHVRFVRSRPYAVWYTIRMAGQRIGAIYLTRQNEIGVHILDEFQRHGIATRAILTLMRRHARQRYLAHVAPRNMPSQRFFRSLGFRCIQWTYERRVKMS